MGFAVIFQTWKKHTRAKTSLNERPGCGQKQTGTILQWQAWNEITPENKQQSVAVCTPCSAVCFIREELYVFYDQRRDESGQNKLHRLHGQLEKLRHYIILQIKGRKNSR